MNAKHLVLRIRLFVRILKKKIEVVLEQIRNSFLRRVATAILQGLRVVLDFARRRKVTMVLFVLTLFGLVASILFVQEAYAVDRQKTTLSFHLFEENRKENSIEFIPRTDLIRELRISIIYNASGADEIEVQMNLRPNQNKVRLSIWTSKNLQVSSTALFSGKRFDREYFADVSGNLYRYFDLNAGGFAETFEGNVFGKNEQELNLSYSMDVGGQYWDVFKIPQRVIIGDLYNISVTAIYPEPTERSSCCIVYDYVPYRDRETNSPNKITINGIDRQGASFAQSKLLSLGIIMGVLSSVIASVLLDFAQFVETL